VCIGKFKSFFFFCLFQNVEDREEKYVVDVLVHDVGKRRQKMQSAGLMLCRSGKARIAN